jgi:hypothetical protein
MRPSIVLASLSLAACASAGPSTGGATRETRIESPKWSMDVRTTQGAAAPAQALSATPAETWRAVAAAYKELGIPLTVADSATHVIGARNVPVRRQLADERISHWLDCGTGAMGLKNADAYSVSLSAMTTVTAQAPGSTAVQTVIEASAAGDGSSEGRVRCASTGQLERRIVDLAAAHLQ